MTVSPPKKLLENDRMLKYIERMKAVTRGLHSENKFPAVQNVKSSQLGNFPFIFIHL